jgi:uncharacterized membrane protein YhaH (DUF805 family)
MTGTPTGPAQPTNARSLRELLHFWFLDESRVDRATFLRHGAALVLLKYVVDAALVWIASGKVWTPLNYLTALGTIETKMSVPWLLPTVLIWALPFFWLGIRMTARRAHDAGQSSWQALLFPVPVINWLLLLALAVAPSSTPVATPDAGALVRSDRRSLLGVIAPGLLIGLVMVAISVYALRDYGYVLFFATPFTMGAVTGYLSTSRRGSTRGELLKLVVIEFAVVAALLVGVAAEGVLCLAMAFPLAVTLGWFGAQFGATIARTGRANSPIAASIGMLGLPLGALFEPLAPQARGLHEVRSSVEIDASPMVVWSQVIAFPPMPEPTEWFFRAGIAYPKYARIEGSGVGAVRYCVFSTGPFVEPITVWEPGQRLAFNVVDAPMPLREVSFYENVLPPHLHGFLESRRGEFRLVALPNGRTRLEGSTWYDMRMGPEGYWQLFGDYLIHRIHERVLQHIRVSAEALRGQVSSARL